MKLTEENQTMTTPAVYFSDLRTTDDDNLVTKTARLLERAGLHTCVSANDLTAIKLHFGEAGNTAFIRPLFIRWIVDAVAARKAKPFLTDANTLYRGDRSDAVSHTLRALKHGFDCFSAGAPIIIADGLRGTDTHTIALNGSHFKELFIAAAVMNADSIINVSHFKGHELTGFGGALKNLGMGCASREGKMRQHATISPHIATDLCTGCGRCPEICPAAAIRLDNEQAALDAHFCIGCAKCITVCPAGAIKINWNEDSRLFQEKMIEYAAGVQDKKKDRILHINFLMNISPACDCYDHADRPIVPDVGILASLDPVAIDQASVDLVNAQPGCTDTALHHHMNAGEDKFTGLYPDIDWAHQLDYAQEFGIGRRDYNLVRV